jgi:hypothetical protein
MAFANKARVQNSRATMTIEKAEISLEFNRKSPLLMLEEKR